MNSLLYAAGAVIALAMFMLQLSDGSSTAFFWAGATCVFAVMASVQYQKEKK
jgi:hypothetical protein